MGAYHNTQNALRKNFTVKDIIETLRNTWNKLSEPKPTKDNWLKTLEPALGVKATTLNNYLQVALSSEKVWKAIINVCNKYPDIKISNLTAIRGLSDAAATTYLTKLETENSKEYTMNSFSKDCQSWKIRNAIKEAVIKELNMPHILTWDQLQSNTLGKFFSLASLSQWETLFQKINKKFVIPATFQAWVANNIKSHKQKLNPTEITTAWNDSTWQVLHDDARNLQLRIDASLIIADISYGITQYAWDDKTQWGDPKMLTQNIRNVIFSWIHDNILGSSIFTSFN